MKQKEQNLIIYKLKQHQQLSINQKIYNFQYFKIHILFLPTMKAQNLQNSQKQLKKKLKFQEKEAQHKKIMKDYQQTHKYYDYQVDQWNKVKYYSQSVADFNRPTYQQLNQLLSSTFKHAKRRQNFFTVIDRQQDYTLRCVYSGQILSNQQGEYLKKCDQQHSFPQSYQRGTKSGTGRDMHAIFSAGKSANGSRGNTPFGNFGQIVEVDNNGTNYKEGKLKTYHPANNRGAVARASLYILTCYKNCANPHYLPKKCLQWLVQMATIEQVSLWQKHRNQQLFRLQGNRNPFIDFPDWAKTIDFSQGWQK